MERAKELELAEKLRKKKHKQKYLKKTFDESNPWKSSSDSSSSAEEDEDNIYSEDDEDRSQLKSDHEFSPESDLEDSEDVKPLRRARTARKGKLFI